MLRSGTGGCRRAATALAVTALAATGLPVTVLQATAADAAPTPPCTAPQQQVTKSVSTKASGFLDQLQPQSAWPITRGGGITVAVLDTGVGPGPAASAALLGGRVRDGGNLAGDSGATALHDCDGRGTADAALVAAAETSGKLPGVAPAAQVLALRVQAGSGTPPSAATLATAIDKARAAGAGVILVASATTGNNSLKAAVQRAVRAGVVVVAAVGVPTGEGGSTPTEPATYPGVIGVAASGGSSDATPSGVSLVAPGNSIAGLSVDGTGYIGLSGPSAAAALVAGTAALVRAANPSMTGPQVVTRLQLSADHPAATLPDKSLGYGTVNPVAALTLSPAMTAAPSPAPARRLSSVRIPAPADPRHRRTAALLAVAALAVALACGGLIAGVRRGRRRGWRTPGSDTSPDEAPG